MNQRTRTGKTPGERYRRSPGLVFYWSRSGIPHCFNVATSIRTPVTGDVVTLLDLLGEWTTAKALMAAHPELGAARDVTGLLDVLADLTLLERQSRQAPPWIWKDWFPEAAFFHFATRGDRYRGTPLEYDRHLRAKATHSPPPPPTKTLAGRRIALPQARLNGQLASVLRERRTWRRFAHRPLKLQVLSALLHWTWGVQKEARVLGQGPIVLKTSPSGGARHPLEAYVLALNVTGLAPGPYHYDAMTHELVAIERAIDRKMVATLVADQDYFARCGALVVMTSVFARKMWRYPHSRAYGGVLVEAGHFGQTFCLLATALGLAPFCTKAFREREVEGLLGVDGQAESAIYIVGVGERPKGHVANPGRIPTAPR